MAKLHLPRSYKRKYYKLLGKFEACKDREADLQFRIDKVSETSSKIEHEIAYLLDTLYDLDPTLCDALMARMLGAEDEARREQVEVPDDVEGYEYMLDLPWDRNRLAITGSVEEDKTARERPKDQSAGGGTTAQAAGATGGDAQVKLNPLSKDFDKAMEEVKKELGVINQLSRAATLDHNNSNGSSLSSNKTAAKSTKTKSRKRDRDHTDSAAHDAEHTGKKRR